MNVLDLILKPFRREPPIKPRLNWRSYNADKMNVWGHSCHPFDRGTTGSEDSIRFVMWMHPRPANGDIVIWKGLRRVIWDVELCLDPDDMCFFTGHLFTGELPESTREPTVMDDLV